jgi:hypothetical protein
MYTHYFAAFVTLAQTLWVVGRAPRDRRLLLRAGLALGLAGVAYALAWLPVLAEQARAEGNLGRAASSWYLHLASIPLVFGVGSTLLWKDAVSPVRIGAGAVAVLAFGGCAVIGIWALRRDRSALSLLLGWLFVPIVVPVLVSVALFPLFYFRYALLAAPAYDVLVAAGLVQLSPRIRAMTAGALAATSALSLWFYFTTVVKHDWRGVVAWVSAEQRPGDVLAFDADFGETAFAHYAGADSSRIRLHDPPRSSLTRYWGNAPGNEAPHSVEDRLVRAARVLLVRSHHDGGGDDHYRAVFDRDWRYVGGRAFQGIEVREYIPVAHAVTPASAGSEPGASGSPPAASP